MCSSKGQVCPGEGAHTSTLAEGSPWGWAAGLQRIAPPLPASFPIASLQPNRAPRDQSRHSKSKSMI
eukprot:11198700-Alexandrium_andersonii.AAC.1